MALRFNKREFFLWLIFLSFMSESFVTAHAAENMKEQALKLADIEVEKYFIKCGSSWYGGDNEFMGPYAEMKRKNAPTLRTYNLSEADKLNGFEWSGTIAYTFQPSRRGVAKKGSIAWKEWSDFGEHFTIHSSRKNGQWQMSVSKRDDQESWVELSKWFHSCEILSGQQPVSPQATSNQPTSTSFTTIGRFSCADNDMSCMHTIQLWRDGTSGVVGLLGYPVMEADTPTSVIEQVKYNSANGALSFQATFLDPYVWGGPGSLPPEEKDRERTTMKFSGTLTDKTLKGVFTSYRNSNSKPQGKGQPIVLIIDPANTDSTVYNSLQDWQAAQIRIGRLQAPRPSLPSK